MAERLYALGLGLATEAEREEALALAQDVLAQAGIERRELTYLASLDREMGRDVLLGISRALRAPLRLFTADRLERETPRLANPSRHVFAAIGCHGVAEAAALAALGATAVLLVEKRKSERVTAALAYRPANQSSTDSTS